MQAGQGYWRGYSRVYASALALLLAVLCTTAHAADTAYCPDDASMARWLQQHWLGDYLLGYSYHPSSQIDVGQSIQIQRALGAKTP